MHRNPSLPKSASFPVALMTSVVCLSLGVAGCGSDETTTTASGARDSDYAQPIAKPTPARPAAPAARKPANTVTLDWRAAPPDVAAPPADAEQTDSGLASKVLDAGTGTTHPTATSSVTVHYTGWTTDGEMFDSSRARGKPVTFPLNRVIAGWTEGLQLMVTGEKRRFWIPQELAYQGRPGPPAGMLVFDVHLIGIQ